MALICPDSWILVKGGHLQGGRAADLLYREGEFEEWLEVEAVATSDTHGSGCTLSAAIAANLAQGDEVPEAVRKAKRYVTGAIREAWSGLGKGRGSLRHHYQEMGVNFS